MSFMREATYAVSGGHEIHLKEAGDGLAVLFLHGSGPGASGASNFRDNWQAFVEAGYRTVLPDLIGYGASSKPKASTTLCNCLPKRVYEALRLHGIEQAVLVGNSLGGGIAIQIALDHPEFVNSLVLMGPRLHRRAGRLFRNAGHRQMVSGFGSPISTLMSKGGFVANLVHPLCGKHPRCAGRRTLCRRARPSQRTSWGA